LGPLARAYYFFNAKLNHEEKKKRAKLYGTLRDGLRPLEPHEWQTAAGSITEVPVTTIPGLRIPFHLSYLVYLSSFSRLLAESYLRTALLACRLRGVAPSFLLHPLDFVGPGEAPEVSFFPGMGLSLERKLSVAAHALAEISKYFHLVPLHLHVAASSAEADKLSSTPASASS
jgi:hypothetical protein